MECWSDGMMSVLFPARAVIPAKAGIQWRFRSVREVERRSPLDHGVHFVRECNSLTTGGRIEVSRQLRCHSRRRAVIPAKAGIHSHDQSFPSIHKTARVRECNSLTTEADWTPAVAGVTCQRIFSIVPRCLSRAHCHKFLFTPHFLCSFFRIYEHSFRFEFTNNNCVGNDRLCL